MSQPIDYSKNNTAKLNLTPREYYEFRLLALDYKVPFTVEWNKTNCSVTTEANFLISKGYIEGIDF